VVEGTDGDVSTLAYKPRRRAVLRVAENVLKIYAKEEEFAHAAAGLRASGPLRGVRTPRMEGELPGRLVTLQSFIHGSRPSQPRDIALEAGELLHDLHDAEVAALPAAEPRHQLAAAAASAQLVAAIRPELRRRTERVLGELEYTAPPVDGLVPSHGDFNARQLLATEDGLAAVDFDAMCLAPPALDPATYAAYLVLGGENDLDEADEVLEELLAGYGDHPLGVSWYLATCILRRSPRPFRYLDEHWPERVEGMVRAAEALVGR
jgi:Ser/Thr protein kinase RdoA (MazF antagonist)